METVTLPPHSFLPTQELKEEKKQIPQEISVCKVNLDVHDQKVVAKFAGIFAGIFVLLQIAGTLYQIFILEQRLLDSGEKINCFLMILFNVVKIGYTMTLIFHLFVLSPSSVSGVKTASFIIAGVQAALSLYLIITEFSKYKNPDDPETISDLWALLLSGVYAMELIIFIVMMVNFFMILFNTDEPAQKRSVTPQYAYRVIPSNYVSTQMNKKGLNANLVAYCQEN